MTECLGKQQFDMKRDTAKKQITRLYPFSWDFSTGFLTHILPSLIYWCCSTPDKNSESFTPLKIKRHLQAEFFCKKAKQNSFETKGEAQLN